MRQPAAALSHILSTHDAASLLAMQKLHYTPSLHADTLQLELDQEESGWTSYLHTQCPTLSLMSSSFDHHSHCTSWYNDHQFQGAQYPSPRRDFNLHFIRTGAQSGKIHNNVLLQSAAAASDYKPNIEREKSMVFPSEESCGSSTLSDANSPCSSPPRSNIKRRSSSSHSLHQKVKRKRVSAHRLAENTLPSQDCLLDDTATSSPSSYQNAKGRQLEVSSNCEEADVFEKFKALEAFIPGLGEMVGTTAEEEMLNVIISHVRALERKVQLLSEVWRLTHKETFDHSPYSLV